jgi:uncharacterized protein YjbJ (UPF0337 family)
MDAARASVLFDKCDKALIDRVAAEFQVESVCAWRGHPFQARRVGTMNWDQIEGKWKQVKGSVKQQWGKLSDDDLAFIDGSKDKFLGRLQERYGISKEQAQDQLNQWVLTVPVEPARQDASAKGAHSGRESRH